MDTENKFRVLMLTNQQGSPPTLAPGAIPPRGIKEMMKWLTREVAGRLLAVVLGGLVAVLATAGLLPSDTRLCVGSALSAPAGHVGPLPRQSALSSNTKVVVEPAAEVPGSPVWSGLLNPPR